jgi:hypothetical protein
MEIEFMQVGPSRTTPGAMRQKVLDHFFGICLTQCHVIGEVLLITALQLLSEFLFECHFDLVFRKLGNLHCFHYFPNDAKPAGRHEKQYSKSKFFIVHLSILAPNPILLQDGHSFLTMIFITKTRLSTMTLVGVSAGKYRKGLM